MNGVAFAWIAPFQPPQLSPLEEFSAVAFVALKAIAEVGSGFMGVLTDALSSKGMSITAMRYAFYGIRIPFIYMKYFIHDAKHDTYIAIVANVLYLFSEIGHAAQWFHTLNLIDLGSISSALGKISILGSVGISPIDASLGIISGIASVLYTIDYIIKLSTGELNQQETIGVCFGLAASLVHIVAVIIFFASGGLLFSVTVGLTLVSVALYVAYWALQQYEIECLKS